MNSNNNGTIHINELPVRNEVKLQKFMKLLHREPGKEEVKTSQLSDELQYLPASPAGGPATSAGGPTE